MSQCGRCHKEFAPTELAPPSTLLRLLSGPVLILLMGRSRIVRGEAMGLYCRRCRRALNACFLFIALAVVMIGGLYVLQELGLIQKSPVPPRAAAPGQH
jgi:hypothetical protein